MPPAERPAILDALEAFAAELTIVETSLAQVSGRTVSIDHAIETMSEVLEGHTLALDEVQRSLGRLHDLVAEALENRPRR
jgi:hypothetical protein